MDGFETCRRLKAIVRFRIPLRAWNKRHAAALMDIKEMLDRQAHAPITMTFHDGFRNSIKLDNGNWGKAIAEGPKFFRTDKVL
jgi:hypothetical protein